MKPFAICLLALSLAHPAVAGVAEALDKHILPSFEAFADAAKGLGEAAASDCQPDAVKPAFNAAFDAWMQVADLHLGPSETGALSIAFWPDARGFTPKMLSQLIAANDPVVSDPDGYKDVSIAARGFFALEMLLFDPTYSDYAADSYTCKLVQAIADDLADQADLLNQAWRDEFANTLRSAGEAGNTTYLTNDEALRALYTQLLSGLEFTADERLGRPMGTFEKPRPARAEAWRSGRSLRNVVLSVAAAKALAHGLADGDLPQTDEAADNIPELATHVSNPGFQDVTDPQERLHVEVVQQAVRTMRKAIEAEIGTPLGIKPGFNSQDGD